MCVFPILKKLSLDYTKSYNRFEYKKKCEWISLKVANKWLRLQKKKGGSVPRIHKNQIRYYFTYSGMFNYEKI